MRRVLEGWRSRDVGLSFASLGGSSGKIAGFSLVRLNGRMQRDLSSVRDLNSVLDLT